MRKVGKPSRDALKPEAVHTMLMWETCHINAFAKAQSESDPTTAEMCWLCEGMELETEGAREFPFKCALCMLLVQVPV